MYTQAPATKLGALYVLHRLFEIGTGSTIETLCHLYSDYSGYL
ncbi:hypothetical protein O4443_00495 [Xylella fastidiosa subsp. pauca]|nr:hypothetical protein [Xylella fastidiosa]WGZ36732.1 hypothetical protein O4443_00495 [Xylella fastidiosa subsp. pauca]